MLRYNHLRRHRRRQHGISLVEIMVGLTVGMIILLAATVTYMITGQTARVALDSARLNAELRMAMDIMVDDLRRAGFNGAISGNAVPRLNRFVQPANDLTLSDNGACIEFTYDASADRGGTAGALTDDDFFGFRVRDNDDVNVLEMRLGGSGGIDECTTGNWLALTDDTIVHIVPHSNNADFFRISYQCLNSRTGDSESLACIAGNDLFDTAVAEVNTSEVPVDLIETRVVHINLSGELRQARTPLSMDLSQRVLVRNHRIVSLP